MVLLSAASTLPTWIDGGIRRAVAAARALCRGIDYGIVWRRKGSDFVGRIGRGAVAAARTLPGGIDYGSVSFGIAYWFIGHDVSPCEWLFRNSAELFVVNLNVRSR